jgi:hypothetical protein
MHIPHIPSLFPRHLSVTLLFLISNVYELCRQLTWGYHRSHQHSVLAPICISRQYQFDPTRSLVTVSHIPSTSCEVDLLRQSQVGDKVNSPPIGLGPLAFAGRPWGWVVGRRVCKVLQQKIQLASAETRMKLSAIARYTSSALCDKP